jgi:hypothetical protein
LGHYVEPVRRRRVKNRKSNIDYVKALGLEKGQKPIDDDMFTIDSEQMPKRRRREVDMLPVRTNGNDENTTQPKQKRGRPRKQSSCENDTSGRNPYHHNSYGKRLKTRVAACPNLINSQYNEKINNINSKSSDLVQEMSCVDNPDVTANAAGIFMLFNKKQRSNFLQSSL